MIQLRAMKQRADRFGFGWPLWSDAAGYLPGWTPDLCGIVPANADDKLYVRTEAEEHALRTVLEACVEGVSASVSNEARRILAELRGEKPK